MTTEQSNENTRQTPGLLLRMAREHKGLSQHDVAHRLNLRVSLIRDIEQDRFDQKTASTFTRGYLKTYARFVGADEQAVLAAYDSLGLNDKKYSEMYSFSGRTQREASEHRVRIISWGICIALAGVGATWWWLQPAEEPIPTSINEAGQLVVKAATESAPAVQPSENVTLAPIPASSAIATATSVSGAETTSDGLPAAESEAGNTAEGNDIEGQAATVLSDAAAESGGQEQDAAPVVPATEMPVSNTSSAASTVSAAVTTASEVDPAVALQLNFTATCWLKITDATGKSLLEGTKNSGDKVNLSGKEPFSLTIGAPRAVSIYFHGQAVDMSSYIRQGVVARYKLPLKN